MNVSEIFVSELTNNSYEKYLNVDLVKIFVDTQQENHIYNGLSLTHSLARHSIPIWYIVDLEKIPINYVINLTNGLPLSHIFLKFKQLDESIYKLFKIWSTHKYCLVAYVPFNCIVQYDQKSFDAWRSFNEHAEIIYNTLKYNVKVPNVLNMSPICYKLHKA